MNRQRYPVQRYQETMRQGFESDVAMEAARQALAQSMRDRSSRDQDEAARLGRWRQSFVPATHPLASTRQRRWNVQRLCGGPLNETTRLSSYALPGEPP